MSKEKSSKSCGSAAAEAAATSKILVIQAKVLDVKKSNDDDVTLKLQPEERSIVVDDNEVSSISPSDTHEIIRKLNYYKKPNFSIYSIMSTEKDDETKVSHVKHAKSSTHQGKKCLEFHLSKKDIKAKGATAREATNLDDINKGDNVTVLLYWDIVIPIPEDQPPVQKSLYDVVEETGSLSTLETALKATDLDEAVKDEDKTYTVFAPNNDAFNKLPSGELRRILRKQNKNELAELLKGHVVEGEYSSSDLKNIAKRKGHVVALNGDEIPIKLVKGELRIGEERAKVVLADIRASNGNAHVIDKVLQCEGNC
jgi:uncharacterized surface protein with fasciclin (FAS1) repeats